LLIRVLDFVLVPSRAERMLGSMKALLLWICAAVSVFAADDYRAAYAKLKEQVPDDKMEALLEHWREADPDNPDAWILSANWFFEKAQSENVSVTTKTAQKGDFVVTDPKTGKAVGSISSEVAFDPKRISAATGFLRAALERWPHRVDIRCGLAHMLETTHAWDEEFEVLRALAEAPGKYPGRLRWCYDEPLDAPESDFIAEKLHSYALHQFQRETPETDEHFHQVAKLIAEAFPNVAYGHNDLAVFHGLTKNWAAAQAPLETAAKVAPKDALVWSNLGDNCARLGDFKRAREAYGKVIELDADPELTAHAKEELAKLDAKARAKATKQSRSKS
jgi:tetratricopeptide (TPR) repeat protein